MSNADDKPGANHEEISDQPSDVAPQLTPEEQQKIFQQQAAMAFQAITGEVFGILQALAPHLSDEEALALAQSVAREQLDFQQIPAVLRSMIPAEAVANKPTLHLYVSDSKGVKVEMKAPKRLEHVNDPFVAAQHAVLLAFILAPGARAVLKAFGFRYHLAQSQTPAGGRVILQS
jgi:hypothetical protein